MNKTFYFSQKLNRFWIESWFSSYLKTWGLCFDFSITNGASTIDAELLVKFLFLNTGIYISYFKTQ